MDCAVVSESVLVLNLFRASLFVVCFVGKGALKVSCPGEFGCLYHVLGVCQAGI